MVYQEPRVFQYVDLVCLGCETAMAVRRDIFEAWLESIIAHGSDRGATPQGGATQGA